MFYRLLDNGCMYSEYESGNKYWTNASGDFHREEGAAIEFADGAKCFYLNGKILSEDKFNEAIKNS